MSDLKTHCKDCLQELGKEYREVHEWLDELFKYTGPDHRGYTMFEGNCHWMLEECYKFITPPYSTQLESMEQIWLAFIMKEKFRKTWNVGVFGVFGVKSLFLT